MSTLDDYWSGEVATGALPMAMPMDSDVHLSDMTISGKMKPLLKKFCAQNEDPGGKVKAMELLTAFDIQKRVRQGHFLPPPTPPDSVVLRPRTAAPVLQGTAVDNTINMYETSYHTHYPPPAPRPSHAVRPSSTNAIIAPPGALVARRLALAQRPTVSHYTTEFYSKTARGAIPGRESHRTARSHRAATATGTRSNNPQPSQDFLIWRQRRPLSATVQIEATRLATPIETDTADMDEEPISMQEYDRAMRGKCRSTYQSDFLGMKQGYDFSDRHEAAAIAQENRPQFDSSTMSRSAYPPPKQQPTSLQNPTTRYAVSMSQGKMAHHRGVIPGVLREGPHMHTYQRTTYETDVNERALRMMGVQDLTAVSAKQNKAAMMRMMETQGLGTATDTEEMKRLLKEMELRTRPSTIPVPAAKRHVKTDRANLAPRPDTPDWVSKWEGPNGVTK